jgi:crotonobetainyl-CoA:carnitine CoA-transferase CaiB-like acyl-CoA transferase
MPIDWDPYVPLRGGTQAPTVGVQSITVRLCDDAWDVVAGSAHSLRRIRRALTMKSERRSASDMAAALNNIRVVDFGHYIAGPLTAMLLADHGADVIHIDRPGSTHWKQPTDAYYNRGKRRITLDLKDPKDREVARRLVASADVVVENFRAGVMERLGIGAVASTAACPRLIYCSLPGFPADDPRAGVAAWEGVVQAATSGYRPLRAHYYAEYHNICVDDASRPLFTPIPLASNLAAMTAATSIVMALIARERTGRGQRVEVPLSEAMIEPLSMYIERPTFGDPPPGSTVGKYKCADGRFVDWTGHPARFVAWLVDAIGLGGRWRAEGLLDFAKAASDPASGERLNESLRELFSSKTSAEWEDIAIRLKIPLVLVRTPQEWMNCEHALASQSIVRVTDPVLGLTEMAGLTVNLSSTPGSAKPRSMLDADRPQIMAEAINRSIEEKVQTSRGDSLVSPLQGISVVDLTTQVAGPTSARILAEFGADVIKVDHPAMLPVTKYINVGKRTMLLDVAQPAGQEVLWRLIDRADVVCQNFAMGWAEQYGIGWEQVHARRPQLVYSSVSLFAYSGPWGPRRGYEMEGQAGTGLASRYGGDSKWPLNQPLLLNDTGTGILGAFAIGLALLHRYKTGAGQHVNSSLSQAATLHQASYVLSYGGKEWNEPSGVDTRGWNAIQRLYRASDRWMFVGARDDQTELLWRTVCTPNSRTPMPSDLCESGAFARDLEKAFLLDSCANWTERLSAVGLGAHQVCAQNEVEALPIYEKKGLIEFKRLPTGVVEKRPGVGSWLPSTPHRTWRPEAPHGHDCAEILREVGLDGKMGELEAAGIIGRVP